MKIIGLLIMAFALANCQRAKNEGTTSVTISLPAMSSMSKTSYSILDNSIDPPDADDGAYHSGPLMTNPVLSTSWSPIVPTGYNGDGAYGINCVIVVAREKDGFNPNECTKVSSSSSNNINFNQISIPVKWQSGQASITMDLPVNKKYSFRLLGFYASDIATCQEGMKFSEVSKPYEIAKSSDVEILGTGSDSVSMTMDTFDEDKYFDQCLLRINSDPASAIPALVRVTKNEFPEGVVNAPSVHTAGQGVCYPIELRLLNANMMPVKAGSATEITVHALSVSNTDGAACADDPLACGTYTQINTYLTKATCEANTSGMSSFYFLSNELDKVRWVRSPIDINHWDFIYAKVKDSAATVDNVLAQIVRGKGETSFNTFDVVGPKLVTEGVCAEYSLMGRKYGNLLTPYSLENIQPVKIEASSSDVSIFSNLSDCKEDRLANPASITFSSILNTFYLKVIHPETAKQITVEETDSTPLFNKTSFIVRASAGSTIPSKIRILSNKRNIEDGKCVGPFKVGLFNENGTAVLNTAAASVSISASLLFPTAGVTLAYYPGITSNIACDGTALTAPPAIASGQGTATFFIKATGTSLGSSQLKFQATLPSGTTASDLYDLRVNH